MSGKEKSKMLNIIKAMDIILWVKYQALSKKQDKRLLATRI